MSDISQSCRLCAQPSLFDLGEFASLPLAHVLSRSPDHISPRVDTKLEGCSGCGLLQLVHSSDISDAAYGDNEDYLTGFQQPKHIDDLLVTSAAIADPEQVIDIGCNDGTLLRRLGDFGYTGLVGVEPNKVAANIAKASDLPIYVDYLTYELSEKIVLEHGQFDAAFCRHVVEHVPDLDGFFQSARLLLKDNGLFVVEVPYVERAMAQGNPSILWEEHVSYFTQDQMRYLLSKQGFEILEERVYAFGGGSMAFVARKKADLPQVSTPPDFAKNATKKFVADMGVYKTKLQQLVSSAQEAGRDIIMYGAAPRSVVVAHCTDIANDLTAVIDDRAEVQERYWPGTSLLVGVLKDLEQRPAGPLVLLGVGAENEFRVRAKTDAHYDKPPIYVSLFTPRDSLGSIETALSEVT